MRRRPLNMSAALSLAVERQVEDILAQAKTACALHRRAHDDDGATFDDALRSGASAPAATPPVADRRPRDLLTYGSACASRGAPSVQFLIASESEVV